MKVLWLCKLPRKVKEHFPELASCLAPHDMSWVLGHLPPPADIELHVACPITKGPLRNLHYDYQGAHFHFVRFPPGRLQTGYLLEPLYFRPLYNQLKPDLVHGWGTESSFGIAARFLAPASHVVQVQGLINAYLPYAPPLIRYRFLAWRERSVLARAQDVFVESGYSKEITQPYCGPDTRLHVVDHPLRSEFLQAPFQGARQKVILFLGNLQKRKGVVDAVNAFAEGASPDWRLVIVGDGNAQEVQGLHAAICASGVEERVEHVRSADVTEIIKRMQQAEVYLLPSYMDTGPTSLKEALAMGLWPVCYDNTGPKEYVTRFAFGSLAETGSVPHLTSVLRQTLAEQPWAVPGRRDEVVQRVRHELQADTIWKKLIRLYNSIAGGRKHEPDITPRG